MQKLNGKRKYCATPWVWMPSPAQPRVFCVFCCSIGRPWQTQHYYVALHLRIIFICKLICASKRNKDGCALWPISMDINNSLHFDWPKLCVWILDADDEKHKNGQGRRRKTIFYVFYVCAFLCCSCDSDLRFIHNAFCDVISTTEQAERIVVDKGGGEWGRLYLFASDWFLVFHTNELVV